MSQHDMVIDNQGFAATRVDINGALAALVSNNSGASEPTTKYSYQVWADTTSDRLKIRNGANNAWVSLFVLSTGAPVLGASAGPITTSGLTQATARMLGRSTAGTGAIEQISVGSALELTGGSLNVKADSVTPAMLTQRLTVLARQSTSSGGSKTFPSIATWAQKVEVDFHAVSENSGANIRVQLGTSAGLVTSGYLCGQGAFLNGGNGVNQSSSGIDFRTSAGGASVAITGKLVITRDTGNLWTYTGMVFDVVGNGMYTVAGDVTLPGDITQVAVIATVGSFDGGSVGCRYTGEF